MIKISTPDAMKFVSAIQKEKRHTCLEFVTGGVELLKAVLHGYAGGLIFMKEKKRLKVSFFKKKIEILLHF